MAEQFTWVASYGSNLLMKPRVSVAKFGDGYEQRIGDGLNTQMRQWKLTFESRPNEVADALESFLAARGAVEAFAWTPLYGAAGLWVCREWTSQPTGPNSRTITATFDEVMA